MIRVCAFLILVSTAITGTLSAQMNVQSAPLAPALAPSAIPAPMPEASALLVYADDENAVTVTTPDGAVSAGSIGMEIPEGSTVTTGSSSAELQLAPNGSAIKLAPNTTFRIDALLGNPGAVANAFTLLGGKLRMVATKLAHVAEGYVVSTPTAICGVRGTDFARRYDPATNDDWLCVLDGVVDFHSPDGSRAVSVRGGTFVELDQGFVAKPVPAVWVKNNFKDIQFAKATLPR
ncbi:MAG TPA: FecR family protein [Spirochaetia bacterium]|nr:FecR family protein [Spirochaetia bacterium]